MHTAMPSYCYGYTKLETPVPVRSLKISTWMGDHSRVGQGCCSHKTGLELHGSQFNLPLRPVAKVRLVLRGMADFWPCSAIIISLTYL